MRQIRRWLLGIRICASKLIALEMMSNNMVRPRHEEKLINI